MEDNRIHRLHDSECTREKVHGNKICLVINDNIFIRLNRKAISVVWQEERMKRKRREDPKRDRIDTNFARVPIRAARQESERAERAEYSAI